MMDFFFGKKASEGSVSAMPSEKTKQRTILVIDANPNHNWYQIFADSTDSEGVQVKVEQGLSLPNGILSFSEKNTT
jgi:hypothetical protein